MSSGGSKIPKYLRIKAYRCETNPHYKGPRWTVEQVKQRLDTEVKGSPFFYKHKYGGRRCLGEVVDGWIDSDGWLHVSVLSNVDESNEYAVDAMQAITSGHTDSFSIGYLMTPNEDGTCSKEWLEVSATDDPDIEGSGGRPTMIVCHSKNKKKERRVLVPLPKKGARITYDERRHRSRESGKRQSQSQKKDTGSIDSLFGILAEASATSKKHSPPPKKKAKKSSSQQRRTKMSGKRGNKKKDTRAEDASSGEEEESSDEEMMDVSSDEESDSYTFDTKKKTKAKAKKSSGKKKAPQQKRKTKAQTGEDSDSSSDEESDSELSDSSEEEEETTTKKKKMSSKSKKSSTKKESLLARRRKAAGKGGDPRDVHAGDDDEADLFMPTDLQKQIARMSEKEKAKHLAALTMKLGDVTEAQRKTQAERKKEQARLAELEKKEKTRLKKYSRKRGRECDEVKEMLMQQGVITEDTDEATVNEMRALFTSPAGERISGLIKGSALTAAERERELKKELKKALRKNKAITKEYERTVAEKEGFEPIEDFPLNPQQQQQVLVQHSRNKRSKVYSKLLGVDADDLSDVSSDEEDTMEPPAAKRRRHTEDEEDYSFINPHEEAASRSSRGNKGPGRRRTRGNGGTRKAYMKPKAIPNFQERMGVRAKVYGRDSLQSQSPGLFNLLVGGATARAGMGDLPPVDRRTMKRFGRHNPLDKDDLGSDSE